MTYAVPLQRNAFHDEQGTRARLAEFIRMAPRLSMGPECAQFEQRFATWQGADHCVLVNSGSSANLVMLQAAMTLGMLRPGARVAFSAVTWATNVMPLMQLGLEPVPMDCSPRTLNVTPASVREAIHVCQVGAVLVTNALGFCDDIGAIRDECGRAGVLLLEDNCESMGARVGIERLGSFGMASTFSFFVGHHMSTIEGGAICTDSEAFARECIRSRSNGWNRNLPEGTSTDFGEAYRFHSLAFNVRPTEITGWLGSDQLRFVEENCARRRHIYRRLSGVAITNGDLDVVDDSGLRASPMAFPLICRSEALRARYVTRFQDAGVEVRPIIAGNITRQPFYQKSGGMVRDLPGADLIHNRGFYCGLFPDMSERDIGLIERCL